MPSSWDAPIPGLINMSSSTTSESSVDHRVPGKPVDSNKAQPKKTLSGIAVPSLLFPKSAYDGYEAPYPISSEEEVLNDLLSREVSRTQYADADFIDLALDEFVIYRAASGPSTSHHSGIVSLDQVALKQGNSTFYFDGVVKAEGSDEKFYLQKVPFSLVSIGGYEDVEQHTVGSDIWIQSLRGQKRGTVWYRLGNPISEYREYFRTFTWLANLAKYFVDYLHLHDNITLEHFRRDFSSWLISQHSGELAFNDWLAEYENLDMRHVVIAHAEFLQIQSLNLDPRYIKHELWDELGLSTKPAVKEQPKVVSGTIVTPYVSKCFREIEWADHLRVKQMDPAVEARYTARIEQMGFNQKQKRHPPLSRHISVPILGNVTISPGDVIATWRDSTTPWKGEDDLWYALVQDIKSYETRRLSILWLYRPSDTVCANLTYPHKDELFLSDHCNCRDAAIDTTQVLKKVNVSFFSHETNNKEFFVRQTYFSEDETFVTLKDEHFTCPCRKPPPQHDYHVGDTVLAESSAGETLRLEPVEIMELKGKSVKVRIFLRRRRDFNDEGCRPNELVFTDRFKTVHLDQIERHCHIRFISKGDIPVPYNRDGMGDAFYVSLCEVESENGRLLKPITSPSFKQGFDPSHDQPQTPLRALNLFSGGGNFDRGLEEGSAIRSEWAVEWALAPMLTYRANHTGLKELKLFCGSVNDYLAKAIKGSESKLVAQLGEVQFISAGSPCQGYSNANANKGNFVSMQNSSMIASVAAYIDFYRPMYAILENVPSMASKSHVRNPLSQLVCTFVGMGYQVRILNLDAWSFGAPQSRQRLFVIIAAPGLQLPAHPPLTHSHPESTTQRSLGEAPNGLPFGKRRFDIPVFDFITASQATKDLPAIGTGHFSPISLPDHRPSRIESFINQNRINSIPKAPHTSGLKEALSRGLISTEWALGEKKKMQDFKRAWSRIHPHLLMPTVTTFPSPWCKFTGRWLHWEEDRVLTIMEVRRAQGFPDSEVLIGRRTQQWKVVGNSVARQVALALGLVVRHACLENERKGYYANGIFDTPSPLYNSETETKENGLLNVSASGQHRETLWHEHP
ncbi:hypothetical protein AJ80_01694 [Polytolypa hystricis UAMH7299]|uniref:DNA (cytosine-5-)-methyltransferase n=1 Tax=Polytolypa hystricis (strain UAMH7299) TaxID=1447883 RepID=A0A2B7YZ10_POLH7|nr:hypothetical protein AJ80_01694 [Polytolypa hystricis UAMH7299]